MVARVARRGLQCALGLVGLKEGLSGPEPKSLQKSRKSAGPGFPLPEEPRGPKDQKKSRFRSRLKISIENEIFERATHRGPIFYGEIETSRLKFSSSKIQTISIEIEIFDRDQFFFLIVGPSGKPDVRNARNSGAGNCWKTPMPKKLFFWGVFRFFLEGGWEVPIFVYRRGDFPTIPTQRTLPY